MRGESADRAPAPDSAAPAQSYGTFGLSRGALISVAAAVALALVTLFQYRFGRWGQALVAALKPLEQPLRAIHSGRAVDYITWLAAGAGALAVLAWAALT